jgi:hypothetical protein
MHMRIWSLVLLACALGTLALALRWVDQMPDVVDGALFGVTLGCAAVLVAWRVRQRPCAPEIP